MVDNHDPLFPREWDKKQRDSQKKLLKMIEPLREATVAIELCRLMESALESMDSSQAARLEEIGNQLYALGLFSKEVALPFPTDGLSESLISDYIEETNLGAVVEDDYSSYSFTFAGGKPTVTKLTKNREKLSKLVNRIEEKLAKDREKKMSAIYATNTDWRKQKPK